jgi:hypothetical protein
MLARGQATIAIQMRQLNLGFPYSSNVVGEVVCRLPIPTSGHGLTLGEQLPPRFGIGLSVAPMGQIARRGRGSGLPVENF